MLFIYFLKWKYNMKANSKPLGGKITVTRAGPKETQCFPFEVWPPVSSNWSWAAKLQRDKASLLPHLATACYNTFWVSRGYFQVKIWIKKLNCEWWMAHKVAFKTYYDLRSAQQYLLHLFPLPSCHPLYFKGQASFELVSKSEFNEVTNMKVNSWYI